MTGLTQHLERRLLLTAICLLIVFALTGCSAFQSTSHVIEPEEPLSNLAVASVDEVFIPEAFSLVAADSIGLATFGFEIALWADWPDQDAVAQQN